MRTLGLAPGTRRRSVLARATFVVAILLAGAFASPPAPTLGAESQGASATDAIPFSRSREMTLAKARLGIPWLAARPLPDGLRPAASPSEPPAEASAKAPVRISPEQIPASGMAQAETQTEPFVALDPRGKVLLAGWQEARFQNGGALGLGVARSTNAGKNWAPSILPGLTLASGGSYERASDPWVAFGPDGEAYFTSLLFSESTPRNGMYVSTSTDSGVSWGPPVEVHTTSTDFDDKQALVVDTLDGSPYRGRVYLAWDTVLRNASQVILRLSYSDDRGATWSGPFTIADRAGHIGVIPLVGPRGVVHAVWLRTNTENAALVIASSTDGGEHWTPPVEIATLQAAGVPGMRTGDGLPSAAVDPKTGQIHVVWQDARFSPAVDQVVLSTSTDGGLTWSPPKRVSDGTLAAANFTPAVAISSSGAVGVAYYSLRNDPDRAVLVDEYFQISRSRGKRFSKATRMSPSSFDTRFAAFSRGWFLGDYQGLVGGSFFHAVWVGTPLRSLVDPARAQPDVFTASFRP